MKIYPRGNFQAHCSMGNFSQQIFSYYHPWIWTELTFELNTFGVRFNNFQTNHQIVEAGSKNTMYLLGHVIIHLFRSINAYCHKGNFEAPTGRRSAKAWLGDQMGKPMTLFDQRPFLLWIQ